MFRISVVWIKYNYTQRRNKTIDLITEVSWAPQLHEMSSTYLFGLDTDNALFKNLAQLELHSVAHTHTYTVINKRMETNLLKRFCFCCFYNIFSLWNMNVRLFCRFGFRSTDFLGSSKGNTYFTRWIMWIMHVQLLLTMILDPIVCRMSFNHCSFSSAKCTFQVKPSFFYATTQHNKLVNNALAASLSLSLPQTHSRSVYASTSELFLCLNKSHRFFLHKFNLLTIKTCIGYAEWKSFCT